ncbi:hypothetical protein GGP66_003280 [Salinibacter ruber]|uniref:Uncharacterized protein n=1 Tax=Salinibacter ruber TaxID=146919 RepID=A0A9X2ZEA7_9BACT|nr:hypothetical protein [Salinibacter ruber]MCS3616588.1 hypothetical protein [Salinibacter ruber]MCS3675830.1 hypothetical protein [Salinibacter ruber]MCS4037884.1 hypothetical protein [Salinibacter ruber]
METLEPKENRGHLTTCALNMRSSSPLQDNPTQMKPTAALSDASCTMKGVGSFVIAVLSDAHIHAHESGTDYDSEADPRRLRCPVESQV